MAAHNRNAVLSKPLSMDEASIADADALKNLFRQIASLLKEIRFGSDLMQLQVPAALNQPRSQLQVFGESVYAFRKDLLKRCGRARSPLDRLIAVVSWTLSTTRPTEFGFAPFNPILGETHHVSNGTLNVLLEQVSHHPPVSALHATDDTEGIELLWTINPVAKYLGNRVEGAIKGKRQLKLKRYEETYLMNSPVYLFRMIPPLDDWVGDVKITCEATGFEAVLSYGTRSVFGRGSRHSVKGKVYEKASPSVILCDLEGHWDGVVRMKKAGEGTEEVVYNAKDVITKLSAPVVIEEEGLWMNESVVVWSEVSRSIISKNWKSAGISKKEVEERQRQEAKQRKEKGETWVPKHFTVTFDKERGLDCLPINELVEPALIQYVVD